MKEVYMKRVLEERRRQGVTMIKKIFQLTCAILQ